MKEKTSLFANLKSDFAAGLVVFLVALPLCLGIAMASGAPLFSGIISGIVGGIVVGYLSQSHVSVSGPAAGLTAIVLVALTDLGAFEVFLTAVVIAGLIQLVLGFIKAGTISNYFPTNVIEGMLAGIGAIIFLKQVPKALGSDVEIGSGLAIFTDLIASFGDIKPGVIVVTLISLAILIAWDKVSFLKKIKLLPGALVAVIAGTLINEVFIMSGSSLAVSGNYLVNLPIPTSAEEFKGMISLPSLAAVTNPDVWVAAITIAIVASIESLLNLEASVRLDPLKRYASANRELKAQGIGNMVCGFIGGLPLTTVIVRTSTNINAGGKSKTSAILHGILLLVCVLAIPFLLNRIPLATLAAVLLIIGYKLAKPATFKHFWLKGKYQFIPFIATFGAVVFTDLLKGVALGMIISVIFILKGNIKRAYFFRKKEYKDGDIIHMDLAQEVSFLNKAAIKLTLSHLPENSKVMINASDTVYIAHDILDLIHEFKTITAPEKDIQVILTGFKDAYRMDNDDEAANHVSVEHEELVAHRGNNSISHKEVISELINDK
ncbi:SulP family inorganic anion transporter [Sinomicrobium weinanense]|uniref:SulP family inorganic anion transporter n=1 Tax=Sinomicrobium weinanense TaxID=2842200 RepID=A0A926JNG0_9FLAO|nr:SulP family inorganic anion transporter [Sinomicrobium weinanense]MBC9794346.1 SulP family inorganic anion transporter [Sinomicrobium weinanense]MBU3124253.1 SulP family inorganic anion transporter [Sinomicrobium weinanense]